jgi:hypothetical protein
MDVNPFDTRQEILDILHKRIHDFCQGYRQNVAILGDELIGKTTLLKHLIAGINDETLIPVYVEIVPFEFSLFLKRFLNSLLYNYLKRTQLVSTRENLELLFKRIKECLPKTAVLAENFLGKMEKEKPELLFRELFTIVETFSMEAKKKCVIIFDEFHNLKKLDSKNICQELGKKIMFEKNTFFIFASSSKNEAKEILANDLSLLFGNFETIPLEMLKPEPCNHLIHESFKDVTLLKEYTDFLIHFSGGHPFYLKTICEEAASLCRYQQKPILKKETLIEALERLLFQEWGIFNLKFLTLLLPIASIRNKNEFIYLLDAIATGKNRLKDLLGHFRKPKKEIGQKLNKLIEFGTISKNGSFYLINDRLMAFWLKFVHHEKLNSLSPDYAEQASHFRSQIGSEIDEFINASRKHLTDRMLDLFNLFEGEEVQMEKKRFHLSPIRDLKIISFDQTNLQVGIFGKTEECLWLAAIKEDGINEHDVNEFLMASKKFKHKVINKVIIGLGETERNARLLAKESNISTWDATCINNLLDLYGKPRIIK